MDLGLKDRVALVTGGSGGIGATVARTLAAEGARVAIGYHSSEDAAKRVCGEIESLGGTAMAVRHDLEDPATIQAAVDAIDRTWGGPDVLVTSAWVHPDWPGMQGPAVDPSPARVWAQQLEANLEGTAHSVNAVVPKMKERSWGRIVFISSAAAEDGQPGLEAYAAAKSGLYGFTRSLARGLGRANILANAIMPGFVATERNRRVVPPGVFEHWARLTPIGRLVTEEEIARTAAFLGSPANGSITGVAVRVSGGH